MKNFYKNKKGVTLQELVVVLAIIGIAAAIAIPSLGPWLASMRFKAAVRNMAMDFNYARSESIRRGVQVNIDINNLAPGSEWYSVYFAQAGTTTYVVPRKTLPAEITIQNIIFSGLIGYNARGIPLSSGSLQLSSSKAPSSTGAKTITVNIGGSVVITP